MTKAKTLYRSCLNESKSQHRCLLCGFVGILFIWDPQNSNPTIKCPYKVNHLHKDTVTLKTNKVGWAFIDPHDRSGETWVQHKARKNSHMSCKNSTKKMLCIPFVVCLCTKLYWRSWMPDQCWKHLNSQSFGGLLWVTGAVGNISGQRVSGASWRRWQRWGISTVRASWFACTSPLMTKTPLTTLSRSDIFPS